MDNRTYFSKEKQVVKTNDQAKSALNILVQNSQGEDLKVGIYRLADQLETTKPAELLASYPDLVQKYKIKKLISGKINIPNASTEDIKTAGLLSCLLMLINYYFTNKTKDQNKQKLKDLNNSDSIIEVLNAVTSEECVSELLKLVQSIVGIDYFLKYQKKMKDPDFVFNHTLGIDFDPEMEVHMDTMVWFTLVRLFIEAIFIYYDSDYETKNDQL